ncbi:MAG: MFS transporter, partial [Chloroflexota bacterium]|nr:MFS transporter [Chloroflexota bacterium]
LFGLGLWVLDQTGNVTAYATLLFMVLLPFGVASPLVGSLVDRWNRRQIMMLATAGASAPTVIVALLYFTDNLIFWHLYIALAVHSVVFAFSSVAMDASTPMLVKRERLDNAVGVAAMLKSVDFVLSPLLAVSVYLSLGLGAVFVVEFVASGVAVTTLALSFVPQPARVLEKGGASLWSEFRFGIRYIGERRPFVYLIFFFSASMFLLPGICYALATPLALSFSNEAGAAALITAFGAGSFLSGLLLTARGGPKRRMNGILAAMALAGAGALVVGLRENLILATGGLFITGVGFAFAFWLNRVIWQTKASPDVLGRVSSIRIMIAIVGQSVGLLIAGPLAQNVFGPLMEAGGGLAGSVGAVIGVGADRGMALLYIISAVTLIGMVVVSFILRPIRYLEDALPDQVAQPEPDTDVEAQHEPVTGLGPRFHQ